VGLFSGGVQLTDIAGVQIVPMRDPEGEEARGIEAGDSSSTWVDMVDHSRAVVASALLGKKLSQRRLHLRAAMSPESLLHIESQSRSRRIRLRVPDRPAVYEQAHLIAHDAVLPPHAINLHDGRKGK
jgi:hypothetical protein